MNPTISSDFLNGLVFGFDIGTASIGWAVRKGSDFRDVSVLICPEDTNDLSGRRGLRRQRRTLRSRKYRRKWFSEELEKLALPRPENPLHNPVSLRLQAVRGDELKVEELHTVLMHLFKRRGYTEVPWKDKDEQASNADAKKEEGIVKERMSALRAEMEKHRFRFPCELLDWRTKNGQAQRHEVWPRELLADEFHAILGAQATHFPQLSGKVNGHAVGDWLLYGDTREVNGHHVFFKSSEARNPGVLGLRWPRFDNRGPALDSFTPLDNAGRPLHVVRKNKPAFMEAQWKLAVMNFRVIERATGKLVAPDAEALSRLRGIWEASRRKPKKKTENENANFGELRGLMISDAQWGRMIVVRSKKEVSPEDMPQQLLFF